MNLFYFLFWFRLFFVVCFVRFCILFCFVFILFCYVLFFCFPQLGFVRFFCSSGDIFRNPERLLFFLKRENKTCPHTDLVVFAVSRSFTLLSFHWHTGL